MTQVTELEKEIEKTRQYLHRLETRLQRARYRKVQTEKERLQKVESEFKRKYPNEKLHPDVLSIAGILPYASRAHDKQILRQALAEKYGWSFRWRQHLSRYRRVKVRLAGKRKNSWQKVKKGEVSGFLSSLTVTTLFYELRKNLPRVRVLDELTKALRGFQIADMAGGELENILTDERVSDWAFCRFCTLSIP